MRIIKKATDWNPDRVLSSGTILAGLILAPLCLLYYLIGHEAWPLILVGPCTIGLWIFYRLLEWLVWDRYEL